jgi:hypothetical protein
MELAIWFLNQLLGVEMCACAYASSVCSFWIDVVGYGEFIEGQVVPGLN